MFFPSILIFLFGVANGHMGISISAPGSVQSRDAEVGDAYRYPNSGHCHGVPPRAIKANYAPGDKITLTLSSGAAHDGGHCALFLASKNTQPTESIWYKQKDVIDCTKMASFEWQIDGTLVPSECADGCTLIWAWTPKSSGACEIYMNCFDISISNPGNNNAASTVQIQRGASGEIPCHRVDAEKKTISYGTYCGATCAGTAGGGTEPPTMAPDASMPPTASPTNPPRCGLTWSNANEECLGECVDNSGCTGDNKCYADMIRLCTTIDTGDTNPPAITPSTCRAVGHWASSPGMDQWCASNCPNPCPATHCICDDSSVQPLNPDQGVYSPTCQIYSSKDGDTLKTIAEVYDLASQVPGNAAIDVKAEEATDSLYQYNSQCNPSLEMKSNGEWPQLPVGTTVYLTGDCQLTDQCPENSASRLAFHSLVCLIAIFGIM